MAETTFGDMLRVARKRAGFSTMAAFAVALQLRGLPYTEEAIGHWEKNRRKPYREGERPIFMSLLQVIAENGGFDHAGEIDTMLAALDRPTLSDGEKETYFPTLKDISPIENLPEQPPYDRLIGRDDELAVLNAEFLDVGGKSVVVISGLGGIGKTAVAYEVVRRSMRSGRFEKLAWESAKSEEFSGVGIQQRRKQTISFHQILLGYVRQLGYESLTNLPPEVLQTRLREIFQSHSYLIVLDNLETLEAAQDVARQLYGMVSPGRSRILITSRKRLADETYVFDYFIRGLSEPDSMSLIRDESEARGAEMLLKAGSTLLHRIYTTTGGMPLALKLIVSQYLLGIALDDELDRLEKAVDEEELYRFIRLM